MPFHDEQYVQRFKCFTLFGLFLAISRERARQPVDFTDPILLLSRGQRLFSVSAREGQWRQGGTIVWILKGEKELTRYQKNLIECIIHDP